MAGCNGLVVIWTNACCIASNYVPQIMIAVCRNWRRYRWSVTVFTSIFHCSVASRLG